MGGLSKKAFQFEKIISTSADPYITLDAGALLFKKATLTKGQEIQEKVTAEAIVKSYNLIGYDAVGVCGLDLIAGLDFLLSIAEKSIFPWLSANLTYTETGKPIFTPFKIISSGPLQIGVIGLTGPLASLTIPDKDKITTLAWQDVLPDIAKELETKTDMLILLSSLSSKDNQAITEAYSNIHIIIQAGISTANLSPQLYNNSLICQTGKQGKYIGVLNIDWQNNKKWGERKDETLRKIKNNLDQLNWQISKYTNKYENPLLDLQNNPSSLERYKSLLEKKKKHDLEAAVLSKALSAKEEDEEAPSSFKNKFIAMETSMPDQKEVLQVVDDLNREIEDIGKNINRTPGPMDERYAGWHKCGECHQQQLSAWQKTRHARAYNTLANKNKQYNNECLFCHVTSISSENSLQALSINEELRDVSCEACHGPGSRHSSSPGEIKITTVKPGAELCLTCHTDDHDDSFDYQRDIKLIH